MGAAQAAQAAVAVVEAARAAAAGLIRCSRGRMCSRRSWQVSTARLVPATTHSCAACGGAAHQQAQPISKYLLSQPLLQTAGRACVLQQAHSQHAMLPRATTAAMVRQQAISGTAAGCITHGSLKQNTPAYNDANHPSALIPQKPPPTATLKHRIPHLAQLHTHSSDANALSTCLPAALTLTCLPAPLQLAASLPL